MNDAIIDRKIMNAQDKMINNLKKINKLSKDYNKSNDIHIEELLLYIKYLQSEISVLKQQILIANK